MAEFKGIANYGSLGAGPQLRAQRRVILGMPHGPLRLWTTMLILRRRVL
jgi:hypothetical protein